MPALTSASGRKGSGDRTAAAAATMSSSSTSNGKLKATPQTDASASVVASNASKYHGTVYRIDLGDDGSPEGARKFVRLPPATSTAPFLLRFVLKIGSTANADPTLLTNYPTKGQAFSRTTFDRVHFVENPVSLAYVAEVLISRGGTFEYKVQYKDVKDGKAAQIDATSSGFFQVVPNLLIRQREQTPRRITLDSVALQSVVPKWLGPLRQWPQHFKYASALHYNMIHFVPLQVRGASNSPYSIYDQLDFDPALFDRSVTEPAERHAAIKAEVAALEAEHGLLSLTDVVWNHTAHNSAWLAAHPEAGYNLENSPHLQSAFDVDEAILQFSASIAGTSRAQPKTEGDIHDLVASFEKDHLRPLSLWQYYVIEVERLMKDVAAGQPQTKPSGLPQRAAAVAVYAAAKGKSLFELATLLKERALNQTWLGARFARALAVDECLTFIEAQGVVHENGLALLRKVLDEINQPFYEECERDTQSILQNMRSRAVYTRIAEDGPRQAPISPQTPLLESYFTRLPLSKTQPSMLASRVVNNGWIWNADPMVDFAAKESKAYLLRDVIVWGDCVKLRYGAQPSDNPYLWAHMAEYTQKCADIFHGFRIDNCHSTPKHVAAQFLDLARQIRPDLYVVAELFTGSEAADLSFMSQLGINSLIREAIQAWSPKEVSRVCYNYGGDPVGSIVKRPDYLINDAVAHSTAAVTLPGNAAGDAAEALLVGSAPHALFMDCTHDNETPFQRHTGPATLCTSALVAFTHCANGSVRGYDELNPQLLDVVNEKRTYALPAVPPTAKDGISVMKAYLNALHDQMAAQQFTERHVHEENGFISIHRQNALTHEGYLLLTRTAFKGDAGRSGISVPFRVSGDLVLDVAATLECDLSFYQKSATQVNGVPSRLHLWQGADVAAKDVPLLRIEHVSAQEQVLHTTDAFLPGSVVVFKTSLGDRSQPALYALHKALSLTAEGTWHLDGVIRTAIPALDQALAALSLDDFNVLLYRTNDEEKDVLGEDGGAYAIPNYGVLTYCGLQGWVSAIRSIALKNDLGHPICDHLRAGHWAMDYIAQRLIKYDATNPQLKAMAAWLQTTFALVKALPHYLTPKYVMLICLTVYEKARAAACKRMSPQIQKGSRLLQSLALGSVQMHGHVRSTGLKPTTATASLAAGLPHFSKDYMRCWGRDIFIALRGLLLLTGRFEEAKEHILDFAATVRHGLIPNLLDSGRTPRYNCRDGVWFWLQSIQDYCKLAPEGAALLSAKVALRFPDDTFVHWDSPAAFSRSLTLLELVQEVLQRHATGITFREINAGSQLDHAMSSAGFDIKIWVDWQTGFVLGGSEFNCGTWMDKMGDSAKAGNRGVPATPRDGAAIEITAMLKSTLTWLNTLSPSQPQLKKGVLRETGKASTVVTWAEWAAKIQTHFEEYYYIPLRAEEDKAYQVETSLVNRRGIYKDTYGSSKKFGDYQLRCNTGIAMVMAPELFKQEHALGALKTLRDVMLGPMGFKTLDPSDWAYRGHYDNANDSDDASVAHGFNYHQGPEWLFVAGYFLTAYFAFHKQYAPQQMEETMTFLSRQLRRYEDHLESSPWAGLPELTNENGSYCHDSCQTQAWSMSTLIELLSRF